MDNRQLAQALLGEGQAQQMAKTYQGQPNYAQYVADMSSQGQEPLPQQQWMLIQQQQKQQQMPQPQQQQPQQPQPTMVPNAFR